jgi:hypothetical protein
LVLKIRNFYPLLGEINSYYETELDETLVNVNSFELNRDKFLLERINYVEKLTRIEAAVFLFRQLEKDIKNFIVRPRKRVRKWRYHFRQIQASLPDSELPYLPDLKQVNIVDSIISTIVFLCGPNSAVVVNALTDKLHMYFEFLAKDIDFSKLGPLLARDPWLFVFCIHRTAYLEVSPFTLNEVQRSILSLQIKWELWGLKTQVVDNHSAHEFVKHTQNLFQKLKMQSSHQWSEEYEILLKLTNRD